VNITKPPLISVIIPCYNLGAYVDEAIRSVLNQTVQDFEILVIDDGSTDALTQNVFAQTEWPRTTVFRTENRGLARARNFLIERSRGTYLCALDADDKLHPKYFETTLGEFARDPGLTFVSTRLQMFGEDDRLWPPALRCDLETLLCDDPIFCAALVKRDAVQAIGGFDENMPAQGDEDWDLWLTLVKTGGRGVILPEVLFYYRRRADSMCDLCTRGDTHLALMTYLIRKHGETYRSHLLEVLLWKEREINEQRRLNFDLERDLTYNIAPRIQRRREELESLRGVLDKLKSRPQTDNHQAPAVSTPDTEMVALQAECERAQHEVQALRSSISWRATAPARKCWDLLTRMTRGRTQ